MNTKPLIRSERIALRVEPDVRLMLVDLMRVTGLTLSDIIRQAVRREHERRFGAANRRTKRHG